MARDDPAVIRASARRPERFEEIFDRHHRTVWRFLARLGGPECADDLAGEVFLQAFTHRDGYDPERGSVRSWLFGIAANLARTRSRGRARAARALPRMALHRAGSAGELASVEDAVAGRDRLDRVHRAMSRLSPADREILVLLVWEGCSYQEIADVLAIELGTVRSRLARARARLRELAEPTGEVRPYEPDA